jgi:outer membrane immunogenic protein
MKNLLLAGAALAAALTATPALAQTNAGFVGPRIELQTGVSDSNVTNSDVTYGAVIGADASVTDRITIGADVDATNAFDSTGRILGAGARLGYAISPEALAFVRGGYANLDTRHTKLDGLAAGGGFQFRLPRNAYLNTEYRYTNYQQGVDSHAGLLGVGIRF